MSTRSSITVKTGNKYHSIYCHFDGYLSHNGKKLLEHYNSQEKAESLVSLGDLSVLDDSNIKPKGHSFDNKIEGYCVYYCRDRGETGVEPIIRNTYDEIMDKNEQEYNYLYDNDSWYVDDKLLTKELIDSEG